MLYFLFGIVFVLIGLPLLNSLSAFFESIFNFFISIFNLGAASVNSKIIRLQKDINQLNSCESEPMNLIGFQSRPKEEYYDDEEDDDDE